MGAAGGGGGGGGGGGDMLNSRNPLIAPGSHPMPPPGDHRDCFWVGENGPPGMLALHQMLERGEQTSQVAMAMMIAGEVKQEHPPPGGGASDVNQWFAEHVGAGEGVGWGTDPLVVQELQRQVKTLQTEVLHLRERASVRE